MIIFLFSLTACVHKQAQLSKVSEKPRNVIMLIGDGMGPEQIGLLLAYARQAPDSVIVDRKTSFDRIIEQGGVMGISMTNAYNVLVTDSAASASQLASGQYAGSEMIGLDKDGNPVETVVEKAIKAGKSTGLITDTRVTHATPAGFAAHQPHRDMENQIAEDMLNAGPDVMFGGGLRYWIPMGANDKTSAVRKELEEMTQGSVKIKSKRKDERNLLTEAQQKGYALAFNKSQMERADGKVLGLFAYSALPDGIEVTRTKEDSNRTIPTLKEMSSKALDILSKNEKGFFLMIEAGLIDWAAHYNDTGLMLHEMMSLNDTLNYVLDWAKDRDDTLIVVTADHTTGGFGLSYTGKNIPGPKSLSGKSFKDRKFAPGYNFGDPGVLDRIYNQELSYGSIFYNKFDALPKEEQTPASLAKLVNQYTRFPITDEQAARVLATEDNPIYVEGHGYLGNKTVPKLTVKDEFFVYQTDDNRQNLLALEVAGAQSVVWNTGTHTATPVIIFTKGSIKAMSPFGKILHHTQVGQNLIDAVLNE
ncbi:MAG: alkaline phosphatase [Proteobacteria bacterium]|nr:alkaline phosphatase [Pseudomonadota bacterium]MBU1585788.1 alkaline phosphatase [Pseudomonadota bacterium]MBU2451782.1 alkaline phosphatase [Pseudomonadota bacterium]